MALSMVVATLLSLVSSLVVVVGSTFSLLCQRRKGGVRQQLENWQRAKLYVCLVDILLLSSVCPLFVWYALKKNGERGERGERAVTIWDVALQSLGTTFVVTVVLVVRPIGVAAVTGSCYLYVSAKRRYTALCAVAAAGVVGGVATAGMVICSQSITGTMSCADISSIKFIIIATQFIFASLASITIIATTNTLTSAKNHNPSSQQQFRPSTLTSRAPSLSLLIHTQSEPWTRRIDLDVAQRKIQHKTDFGPLHNNIASLQNSQEQEGSSGDYGAKIVRGILGDTGGSDRMTVAATTSLGYASAVPSSTNPYHVGSTFSRTSQDALGALAASRTDLASALGTRSKYRSSTTKIGSSRNHFQASRASLRTPSPGLLDADSLAPSGLSRSATEERLISMDQQVDCGETSSNKAKTSPTDLIRLISSLLSLWCPIALSTAALLTLASKGQTFILLSSFCVPASILVLQELSLGYFCPKKGIASETKSHQAQHDLTQHPSREDDRCSRRASTSSSVVVVQSVPQSLRNRRPHTRSFSCPLESELNGYREAFFEWDPKSGPMSAKQRQSLSSARSVPYLGKHWTAGKVKGDRVVAPRNSFIRGLNLMLNPHPKLEILPVQGSYQDYHEPKAKEDGSYRESLLRPSRSTAIVEDLLEAPQGQGHHTTDSERTCITQGYSQDRPHAASSMTTLLFMEGDSGGMEALSSQRDRSREMIGNRSTDVILDMDDTPGSPRLRPDMLLASEHGDLQSPTKRQVTSNDFVGTPRKMAASPAATTTFSRNDDSGIMGSSASRLFSEIMDMVRGNGRGRMSDQPNGLSFGQNLRRTPPKGYASIDGASAQAEASVYKSAYGDGATVIIHPDESSGDFCTAASQDRTQTSFASQSGIQEDRSVLARADVDDLDPSRRIQEESGLFRKGSTSSTLSFSSISSRLRSMGRSSVAAAGTPFGSPSTRGEHTQIKKVRSRTFASAFGIELGLLSRNGSRGRRDTPGSLIESSPSTSAGTCPSSLMDLSFSPSPAASRQEIGAALNSKEGTSSPGDVLSETSREGHSKRHRRNQSRADSIMDMLDDEHGDTIEEMLDPADPNSTTSHVDARFDDEAKAGGTGECREQPNCLVDEETSCDEVKTEFDDLCEVDLGDVTVNDVWERCFGPMDGHKDDEDEKLPYSEVEGEEVDEEDDLMGFDMRRMVAKAPFLDTVEEDPEGELEADGEQQGLSTSEERAWDQSNELQKGGGSILHTVDGGGQEAPCGLSCVDSSLGVGDGSRASRVSLLLEQEAKQRQITQLLAEHETMFPHKTLSQIEEVTELTTTLRTWGYRTNSGASGSKLLGEKTSNTTDSSTIHLGLPLSLRCQKEAQVGGLDDQDDGSTASMDTVEVEISAERDQEDSQPESGVKPLSFVTPRSRMRCRAAAGRRAAMVESAEQARIDTSPRSVNVRLGQLGMDQGIWKRSPFKLELDGSSAWSVGGGMDQEGSFQLVDASFDEEKSRVARLRRSLTLTSRKLVRLDHHDSPKRDLRNRLASMSSHGGKTAVSSSTEDGGSKLSQEALKIKSSNHGQRCNSSPQEKRLLHKPIKKRRKSRVKGVAVMIARHQFTVVDQDDSLIQRFSTAQAGSSDTR